MHSLLLLFRSLHLVSNVEKLVVHFFLSPLDQLMRETRHSSGETTGLLPQIRETGAFKSLEESKRNATNDDDNKSSSNSNNARKFQFVCMGNVNAAKTRIVISEKTFRTKSGQPLYSNKHRLTLLKRWRK